MAKEFAKRFYNGKQWKNSRDGYIGYRMMVDGGLCEICHDQQGYIVHHKIALTPSNINNPDVTLSWDNLQYVCKQCHDKFDGHGLHRYAKKKSRCMFDDDGHPIEAIPPKI